MKFKDYVLSASDATEGERALIRIADALEAGEMPEKRDAELLIDAAELLRVMVREKHAIDERREAFTRKLKMIKPPHRTERVLTGRDVLEGEYGPAQRAEIFWLARANGNGYSEAIRQTAEMTDRSISTIKRDVREHPEQREIVLLTYRQMADYYRAEHGEDHAGLMEAIERLGS